MNFVVSVLHAVDNIHTAAVFFREVLEFPEVTEEPEWIQVSNGAVAVRLVPTTSQRPPGVLEFDMETPDLATTAARLQQDAGFLPLSAETRVRPERAEMRLQGPHGIRLTLIRIFNEDELGILPDLPVSITWTTDADTCIKNILRSVPVIFRGLARRRVTERAEKLTLAAGRSLVDTETALHALVRSTPAFQHQRLREEIRNAGMDPAPFFADLST